MSQTVLSDEKAFHLKPNMSHQILWLDY